MEKILAKPLINHIREITGGRCPHLEIAEQVLKWTMTLSQPFDPKIIYVILAGFWFATNADGYSIYDSAKSFDGNDFYFEAGSRFMEINNDLILPIPETLNDFLSDIHRADIKATFSAAFIEKHGLK